MIHAHLTEAEQRRSAAATRARLMGKPAKPKPLAPVLQITAGRKPVDASYHMVLYRKYQANLRATFSMASSFIINPVDEYCPYHSEIVFTEGVMPRKTMKQIAEEVLDGFPGVTLEEIKGKHRERLIAIPRQLVMYEIARQLPSKSYPEIGRFLGGRDHTTILHAVRKMKALYEQDADSEAWMERKERGNRASHAKAKQMGVGGIRHDCDICRGAGVIRVPIYRPASLRCLDEAAPMTMKMEESSRVYACPECAHEAPEEKVLILGAVTTVNERDVKQYRSQVEQPVRSQLAMLIAHKMIEDGVVEFSERPARMDVVELFARVGVVSKARVATIDKRATEKMGDFLNGVLEAAGDSIAIWGSDYTGNEGHIPKGMAIDFVSKAFSKALKDIQNGQ